MNTIFYEPPFRTPYDDSPENLLKPTGPKSFRPNDEFWLIAMLCVTVVIVSLLQLPISHPEIFVTSEPEEPLRALIVYRRGADSDTTKLELVGGRLYHFVEYWNGWVELHPGGDVTGHPNISQWRPMSQRTQEYFNKKDSSP